MNYSSDSQVDLSAMKVAIVHEWFVDYAGSERVVEQMLNIFPQADIFAQVEFLPNDLRWFIKDKKVNTTFIQKLPKAKSRYRSYLPLMPIAVEQFDLSEYDLILSSNHAVSKGVITGPDQIHITYCHSPIRYAWDLTHQYLKESGLDRGLKGMMAKAILHYIRQWDHRSAMGVDEFISNSEFVARRIWKVYRREATVIHPPVDVAAFELRTDKEDFYMTASRMVPYKKIDLIVEAFTSMPEKKLIVIGDGPDFEKIKAKAGPNVTLMGYQPFDVLRDHMQRARAFVFAAQEDFGIVPVEAQACGTPVIAFGKGGALETVVEYETGMFFPEQTVECLSDTVGRFDNSRDQFEPMRIRAHAETFSIERFQREYREFVTRTIKRQMLRKSGSSRRTLHMKSRGESVLPVSEPYFEDDLAC